MAKTQKAFRASALTLRCLEDLCKWWDTNATDVIETSIRDAWNRERDIQGVRQDKNSMSDNCDCET